MTSVGISYSPRPDATSEGELSALASCYAYLLKNHGSKKADKLAPEPDGRNDAATVRNTEEVSHVEQRPDRPSKIAVTNSRKLRTQ